jgi:hypothetical protein
MKGEAHTIGEELVSLCAADLSACVTDEKASRKIQLVPLPGNKTQRSTARAANALD